MGTATTKHDIVKRIAAETKQPRNVVKQITQALLDDIIDELAHGRRLEFRDFGVFDVVTRKPRVARNPRTGEPIHVPAKTVVHFKQGRVMKARVAAYGEGLAQPHQAGKSLRAASSAAAAPLSDRHSGDLTAPGGGAREQLSARGASRAASGGTSDGKPDLPANSLNTEG